MYVGGARIQVNCFELQKYKILVMKNNELLLIFFFL